MFNPLNFIGTHSALQDVHCPAIELCAFPLFGRHVLCASGFISSGPSRTMDHRPSSIPQRKFCIRLFHAV
ncbi:unnamed protein product [Linum trigynum]|uniref:Uncharacterized protein n=1 Tax=Linum trigynum TaxID=586398 RepID=A0AAV2CH09_9ROSI